MPRFRVYSWGVIGLAVASLAGLLLDRPDRLSDPRDLLFWVLLVAVAETLPVALGFEAQVTMGFPLLLSAAIVLDPAAAMIVAGIGMFDQRELKGEIPLHRSLFNRAQVMLAVGAMALIFSVADPFNPAVILLAALMDALVNLGLVAGAIHFDRGHGFIKTFLELPPRPVGGFAVSYGLLAILGAATARAYLEIGSGREWVVVAILIPLLFGRMTIQGAKAQQELSERIRKQQQALLAASEQVFQEREHDRARIAESLHDTSLQMLAAAAYGCANASQLLRSGQVEKAEAALSSTHAAVNSAIGGLRDALVDLRRSAIEEGGLMETIRRFVEELETLWEARISIEGDIPREPPTPVALAAFQILQEALVNALKHSGTKSVTVRLREDDGRLHVAVLDAGRGLEVSAEDEEVHMGMRLMRQRAEGVGGEIEVESRPGEGTHVKAVLPAGIGL